jgi:adenosylcobinamide kinase / adenosylcobinamide-phosphate guanylyltransferase
MTLLVTGGSGSGKSAVAQRLAAHLGDPVIYLATGRATGPEMAARIRKHQASRPQHWSTVEAPRDLADALRAAPPAPVILLEDLPSLATSCLPEVTEVGGQLRAPAETERRARAALEDEVDAVVDLCASRGQSLVIVTSEVGSGVLPEDAGQRLYKDVLGRTNARLAAAAERTILVVAGLAVDLTALDRALLRDLGLADRSTVDGSAPDRPRRAMHTESGRRT